VKVAVGLVRVFSGSRGGSLTPRQEAQQRVQIGPLHIRCARHLVLAVLNHVDDLRLGEPVAHANQHGKCRRNAFHVIAMADGAVIR
jgi:hypothetical protein